jgi:hypothetical protein
MSEILTKAEHKAFKAQRKLEKELEQLKKSRQWYGTLDSMS